MNVGGKSYTQQFTVVKDPRTTATDADLKEQFDLLMKIRDKTSQANDAVKTIRNVKADRKSTRLNSSHMSISYAVFCLKKKMKKSQRKGWKWSAACPHPQQPALKAQSRMPKAKATTAAQQVIPGGVPRQHASGCLRYVA